ncbi:MAG: TonB-dependent receptor [Saprospiraceae bacterium]|nr:MAG: TonB-dependent receptor [Saprospiraceae bacterium]
MQRFFTLLVGVLFSVAMYAQAGKAVVTGLILDIESKAPVELVTIYIEGTNTAVESAANGRYRIEVPANQEVTIAFTRIGYKETSTKLSAMPAQSTRQVDVSLAPVDSDIEVVVRESKIEDAGMVREDVSQLKLLPTTTGNLESALPHIALGVSSGSGGELSSQYNVRGGNYDENLVYVNDFEIYRPQLIRAGQQEGLTFPNIDLIRDLSFSSGGFDAKYGDKLSSVLDVKYKRPDSTRASVGMSFLGGSAHIEGSMNAGKDGYRKLRYLLGARYKTTRYLLGTLDVQGEYVPNFADVQAYVTYDLSHSWQLGLMGNYNSSVYRFKPETRSTALGLINFALQLFSVFEGQEVDDFTTSMGGLSLTYIPDRDRNPYYLKFLGSTFRSDENERIDIIGDYSLREIETSLGSEEFGEVLSELGTGTQHQYVRNFLDIRITNIEHKGGVELQLDPSNDETSASHFLQWSVKYQQENFDDRINEWERLDSAGYSLPYDTNEVRLFNVLKTRNDASSNRFSAYLQDTYTWRKESVAEIKLSAGVRASYWDLNEELIISPRAQLLFKPLASKRDVSYRLAGGLYFQPPFYREMRAFDGTVNTNLKSQKSFHIVGGMTFDFNIGKSNPKKFRFIAEAYYKRLWDLVSYEIENVRIRYSGQNDATGYVAGVDFRINGEFVPGAESWINLSFLKAKEKLDGVQHLKREVGQSEATPVDYVSRPTDQFMTMSMFFQDYLRRNKDFKMHLNFTVGTGLPFGLLGNNEVYRNTYRFSPYHRVDIGFSVALWNEENRSKKPRHPLRFSRSTWLSLEVFNLLQVQNQAGNTWIKTILNQQYAIPTYLTSRRINLRMRMEF